MSKNLYEAKTVEELANKIDEVKVNFKMRNKPSEKSYKIDSGKGIREQFENIDFYDDKPKYIFYLNRSEMEMLEKKTNPREMTRININVMKYVVDEEGNLYEPQK